MARTHLGVRKDLVSVPLHARHAGRDGAARRRRRGLARHGRSRDARADDAGLQVVERDYTAIADKLATIGPLADSLGFTVKNVTYRVEEEVDRLAAEQRRDARRRR